MQITEFGKILILLLVGIAFTGIAYLSNYLLRKDKPNELKNSPYECGEAPMGDARIPLNLRFYVMALVFLLFEVEIIFIFPWSVVFAEPSLLISIPSWGWITLTEMVVFIGILLLGLWYLWTMGDIQWAPEKKIVEEFKSPIPLVEYEKINQQNFTIKKFELRTQAPREETATRVTVAGFKSRVAE